jgi:hypothetical protein
MPFQQIFFQLGLRDQIGGVGGRSHPGFRHFHTTKTQSRHAERAKIPALRKGQPPTGQWVVAAKSIDPRHRRLNSSSWFKAFSTFGAARATQASRTSGSTTKLKRAALPRSSNFATLAEDVEILANLLSLPRNTTIELPPPERRKRTIDVITRRIEALAGQQPVLALFEDVHWIDPTSLDVLSRIVDQIRDLAVLLLVTFRPEFNPPWAGQCT